MKIAIGTLLVVFISVSAPFSARAEEESPDDAVNFEYRTVTTKEGLTFRVPEDMPVEERNGIVAPIPFDEYMYGKFRQMDNKLKSIDQKLDRIEQLLADPAAEKRAAKPAARTGVLRSAPPQEQAQPKIEEEEEESDV